MKIENKNKMRKSKVQIFSYTPVILANQHDMTILC